MDNGNIRIIIKTLIDNGFNQNNSKYNWSIYWHIGKVPAEVFDKMKPHQKVNHIPKIIEITRKDKMNRNISSMVTKYGKEFDFVPKTYLLPQELALLIRDSDQKKYKNKYYICKPGGSSQGKGIFVTNNIDKIMKGNIQDIVVSEYIPNPLLINGLKFDLRIYVLITSVNPLKIYLYDDGLARFATEKFSLAPQNMKNKFSHLTNFSINKANPKFDCNDEESVNKFKWTLKALKVVPLITKEYYELTWSRYGFNDDANRGHYN